MSQGSCRRFPEPLGITFYPQRFCVATCLTPSHVSIRRPWGCLELTEPFQAGQCRKQHRKSRYNLFIESSLSTGIEKSDICASPQNSSTVSLFKILNNTELLRMNMVRSYSLVLPSDYMSVVSYLGGLATGVFKWPISLSPKTRKGFVT